MTIDLLTLGTQGVHVAQRQLDTTGHNIANVNTEGFSRQRVEQATNEPTYWVGHYWGNGVHVANVSRSYDKFAAHELNLATSANAFANAGNSQLSILDDLMSFSGKAIPENLNEFFGALKQLADTPNDMAARKVVLENANIVADSLNSIHNTLQVQNNDSAEEIDGVVRRINDIGVELGNIHRALMQSDGKANDLLDKHQNLINELSMYTHVTVNQREQGGVNVLIGTGNALVSGSVVSQLKLLPNEKGGAQRQLALQVGNSVKLISDADIRGKLGALIEFRGGILTKANDELGLLASGFALKMNELQAQGIDLNGNVGSPLFNDFNDAQIAANRVVKSVNSTADIAVFIDDINQIAAGDYQLSFDGTNYQITDPFEQSIELSATGTPPSINAYGMRIEFNSPMAAGEKVKLRPVRQAAGQIHVQMRDASKIAAQSFVNLNSILRGDGKLTVLTQGAQKEFQVVISPDAKQFSVLDMDNNLLLADKPYPPTAAVNVNGTVFSLTQGAAENDRFVVSLLPADGDNSNLLLMEQVQTQKILAGGKATIFDVYQALNTDIGVQKASFERLAAVSGTELDAAKARVAEISGVNLDEEAANMLRFQQAYMASSRVIAAANETFETLLNATRG